MDSYRFAGVEIRPVERQVLIDGVAATLRAKAFDLLVALVERRDRVVSRAELYDVVWAGRVVEDNNLAVQVYALRKLLGERAVVTVPGRGYRFALTQANPAQRGEAPAAVPRAASPAAALPEPAAKLLGRDDELAALDNLLEQHRLVTVTGAGGIGKTVFALAGARARRDAQPGDAVWVELAQVLDPNLLAATVAQAFGLPVASGADPLGSLVGALASTQALLVLDNAEHLVEATAGLASALLAHAPGVRLLATSQIALKIDGERVFRLGGLAVPELGASVAEASGYGAVALFAEAANAADRRFSLEEANVAAVIELCRHLDGMPLAIKLAAARLPFFGLHGLEAALAERLKLIGGGHRNAPTRQHTLRAALDWSHSLLSADEQTVFRRLGVFVGGFTLQFAIDVVMDARHDAASVVEMLSALVDRSLVVASDDDPPRYRLLESAREYALLRLAQADEASLWRQRHASVVAEWMAREEAAWWVTEDADWTLHAALELDNVRSALEWSAAHDRATAVALIGCAQRLFLSVDVAGEYLQRSGSLESLITPDMPASISAKYWVTRAQVQAGHDYGRMHEFGVKAEALYRKLGDLHGLYYALSMKVWSGRLPEQEARQLIEELSALERLGQPAKLLTLGYIAQSQLHYFQRSYVQAGRDADIALAHARSAGMLRLAAVAMGMRAMAHYALGEVELALPLCRAAVAQERRRYGIVVFPLGFMAVGLVLKGQLREARDTLVEVFRLCRAAGWWLFNIYDEAYLLLAVQEGRHEAAARLLGYVDRKARPRVDIAMAEQRTRAARAALEARFDAPTLQRLLDEGARLDEEAVCALTLDSAGVAIG